MSIIYANTDTTDTTSTDDDIPLQTPETTRPTNKRSSGHLG
jgi:hypothetical protein